MRQAINQKAIMSDPAQPIGLPGTIPFNATIVAPVLNAANTLADRIGHAINQRAEWDDTAPFLAKLEEAQRVIYEAMELVPSPPK